jgi:hypothetical protein
MKLYSLLLKKVSMKIHQNVHENSPKMSKKIRPKRFCPCQFSYFVHKKFTFYIPENSATQIFGSPTVSMASKVRFFFHYKWVIWYKIELSLYFEPHQLDYDWEQAETKFWSSSSIVALQTYCLKLAGKSALTLGHGKIGSLLATEWCYTKHLHLYTKTGNKK